MRRLSLPIYEYKLGTGDNKKEAFYREQTDEDALAEGRSMTRNAVVRKLMRERLGVGANQAEYYAGKEKDYYYKYLEKQEVKNGKWRGLDLLFMTVGHEIDEGDDEKTVNAAQLIYAPRTGRSLQTFKNKIRQVNEDLIKLITLIVQ